MGLLEMVTLETILIIAAVAFGMKYFGIKMFKALPGTKNTAGLIALVAVVAGAVNYGWAGDLSQFGLPSGDSAVDADVSTAGITLVSDGSESDALLTYEPSTHTFTALYYENLADSLYYTHPAGTVAVGAQATTATFTITLRRTDSVNQENATIGIRAIVPTFNGVAENSGISYQVIDKDETTDLYEVAINPAGVATRDEQNWVGIGWGASVAVVFTCDLDTTGLRERNTDTGETREVRIEIDGLPYDYILKFVAGAAA